MRDARRAGKLTGHDFEDMLNETHRRTMRKAGEQIVQT
jgi:hypothetical protein